MSESKRIEDWRVIQQGPGTEVVLAAIKGGEEIEVVVGSTATSPATEQPVTVKTYEQEKKNVVAKPEKPQRPQKEDKVPGERMKKSRRYMAGVVVAKYGIESGVTAQMIEELDKMYGKANPRISAVLLLDSIYIISGYVDIVKSNT